MRAAKDERKSFPAIGLNTGKWLLTRKRRIYAQSNLTIVCPSRWLQGLACESPLLQGKDIRWIPNGIDTGFFRPSVDKGAAKRALGIGPERKVVLLTAEKLLKSDYKGGADLLKVLKLLDTEQAAGVTLLTLGHDALPHTYSWLQTRSIGYMKEQTQILAALQASDVYIHTSRADNLPNTLIEAISCGLPCVAFDIGGCGEIVRQGENGFLIPPFHHQKFAEQTAYLLHREAEHRQFSEKAREIAVSDFDVTLMADRYFQLFSTLLGSRQRRGTLS
jgi:glycosyltransferase involved in cell wall biosynthesis